MREMLLKCLRERWDILDIGSDDRCEYLVMIAFGLRAQINGGKGKYPLHA
jgi:hypothetical protein